MQYFIEKDKLIKSIAIDDQEIMVADDPFPSAEALEAHIESGKKKLLDTVLRFPYSAITRIKLFEGDNCIQLLVNKNGKTEKVPIEFTSKEQYLWLLDLVKSKTGLEPISASFNSGIFTKIKRYVFVFIIAMFCAALIVMAYETEHGKSIVISGSKQGYKRLIASLAEALGFYGSIAVGIVITGGALVWAFKKNKAPYPGNQ